MTAPHADSPALTLPRIAPSAIAGLRPIPADHLPQRYLWPGELDVIVALVASVNPRTVLEIGCNTGRTARAVLDHVPTIEHYQGIDVPPGYSFGCAVQAREVPSRPGYLAEDDPRFELILRARGSFDLTPADLRPADAVFIDGDHSRAALVHDTILADQLVRPGGIILWHDYHNTGTVDVRDFLHDLVAARGADPARAIQHVAGTWVAFQRC